MYIYIYIYIYRDVYKYMYVYPQYTMQNTKQEAIPRAGSRSLDWRGLGRNCGTVHVRYCSTIQNCWAVAMAMVSAL